MANENRMSRKNVNQGGMSRAQFLRTAGIAGAGVAAAGLGFSGVARAAPGETNNDPYNIDGKANDPVITVYPTGSYPKDMENVQWAATYVASGGTVILKATSSPHLGQPAEKAFDFGVPTAFESVNYVKINRNINVRGEAIERADGGWTTRGTTIMNGRVTFAVGMDAPTDATIKDIIFDGFYAEGVLFRQSSGYKEVSGCSFVRGQEYFPVIATDVYGMWAIVADATWSEISPVSPDALSGELKILNNYFGKPGYSHMPWDFVNNFGLHVSNCNVNATIDGNWVEDAYWVGIGTYFNKGTTYITNNTVNKSLTMLLSGNGIEVGIGPLYPGIYQGTAVVAGNTVNISSSNQYSPLNYGDTGLSTAMFSEAFPLMPPGVTYTISGNTVNMSEGSMAALACVGATRNSTWKDNVVSGKSNYAILVKPGILIPPVLPIFDTAGVPTNNLFASNDSRGFTALIAQAGLIEGFPPFGDMRTSEYTALKNNDYGMTAGGQAGALVFGAHHSLTNENFWGEYKGLVYTNGVLDAENSQPCIYLAPGSSYVSVTALKNGQVINGIAKCNQLLDMNRQLYGTTTNIVPGLESCSRMDVAGLQALKTRIEGKLRGKPVPDLGSINTSRIPPKWMQ